MRWGLRNGQNNWETETSHSVNITALLCVLRHRKRLGHSNEWGTWPLPLGAYDWTGERDLTATTLSFKYSSANCCRRKAQGLWACRKGWPSMRGCEKLSCTKDDWAKLWRTDHTGVEQSVPGRENSSSKVLHSREEAGEWGEGGNRHQGHRVRTKTSR